MTTQSLDDFIKKVRSHAANPVQVQFVDDLEVVLRALFVSDDEKEIEMSDQVRDLIGRKRVAIDKRLKLLAGILSEGYDEWSSKWSPTGAHE